MAACETHANAGADAHCKMTARCSSMAPSYPMMLMQAMTAPSTAAKLVQLPPGSMKCQQPVSYTHLRAHETRSNL
eukprot:2168314-Lingulodinium_polyedra.AAC.1